MDDVQRCRRDNTWSRVVFGTAILAVGVIVFLDHQGRIDASQYLRWWSLILIGLGLAHLPERRWGSAAWLIVAGIVFLPRLPLMPRFYIRQLIACWPLLISFAGATLVWQALRPAGPAASQAGRLKAITVMGGNGRTVGSSEFAGGDAVAVMGGCEIDLRNAVLTRDAVVDVLAFWGGIGITVPRNWIVEPRMAAVLGALVDKTAKPAATNGAPRLILRGSVIMGGIEIRNPKEDRV